MGVRETAEGIVENYPYSDADAAVAHIEAALRVRDEQVWKDAYILVWGETSESEFENITVEVYRQRILKKLKDASAIREGED